ncbi:uncharacterized protein LOC123556318 [Mercenaria mercenaria]|uniref:uncharacterized protein LOC123556318 n=1 Tax=Mercenaria mercenaria TaxID=6596 RepID=UPI00234F905E|nr:uncharacterized protein LOC123556318 [Mercenaria mercenaria]
MSLKMSAAKKSVCVIGAGPCGMSALYHFGNTDGGKDVDVVCYEKQSTWGGLWNFSWRTGNDEFGELCHNGMYKNLWCNSPKETIEFPDYTYEDHFGKAIPSYPPRPVLRDYLEGRSYRKSFIYSSIIPAFGGVKFKCNSFSFMEDELRLQSSLSMYPDNLYKGTLWLGGGGNKLFYMGIQDQYYSYTIYDAQGLWTCKYILGQIPNEPKSMHEMKVSVKEWRGKCSKLKSVHDDIDFQTEVLTDWCKDTGYPTDATKAGKLLHEWEQHKVENIVTYRDQCFTSVFTGTKSPKHSVPWWKAFDDSIDAFVK